MPIEYHGMIFDSEDDENYKRWKKTIERWEKDDEYLFITVFIFAILATILKIAL